MARVLARRDVNKKVLNDYILDERERFEILGPGRFPLHRTNREYTWFVREGIHVRSPVKFDGVTVPEPARVEAEDRWVRREKARAERKAKGQKEDNYVAVGTEGISTNVVPTEPRFVSESYFMDFKFEPGNYYLAGREVLEGHEVLKIEYYPTKMFGGKDDEKTSREAKGRPQNQREQELEHDIARKMNKTALVTLWVDPTNHQIVKYTFDNVWLDFLPAAWLVRVDSMRASMSMFQPFQGVWLPRGMEVSAGVTLANGSFQAGYSRSFAEYRQADVKSKIRIPKLAASASMPEKGAATFSQDQDVVGSGPWVPEEEVAAPLFQEVVREVRVHGNAAVPDAEVLRIAGITVGAAVDAGGVAAIEQRLKDSGLFSTIEVRTRYRSLTDPNDIALILVVHEKTAVVVSSTGEIERPVLRRITDKVMFLPILNYADGYGLTYGVRFSTVSLLGAGERLSVPLSWGGTRRVALEAERTFDRGPLTRILGSVSLWQRENPGFVFEEDDDDSTTDRRFELEARAERNIGGFVYTGVEATRARVAFGPFPTVHQWTVGADAALDTRGNPAFPANAIYLGAGWNALHHPDLERATNRYDLDARAYLRPIGQPVLAGRVRYLKADGPLPAHERYLIGGSDTLRGFRAGTLNGTEFLVTSGELRVPITSVVTGARLGLTVFMDAVNKLDAGDDIDTSGWRRSAGGGLFLIASVIRLNLDVARGIGRHGGDTRVHLSSGFAF
ncbi:MAG: BamA/TamA family outer membrane protein [Vicinamibacterales bacterium]